MKVLTRKERMTGPAVATKLACKMNGSDEPPCKMFIGLSTLSGIIRRE
jgi:hypothetical protein